MVLYTENTFGGCLPIIYNHINWLLRSNHFKSYDDLFCTLYLQFSSKFHLSNVYNSLLKEWFGLRTLFTIRANYIELLQNERFTMGLRLRWIEVDQHSEWVLCWNLLNFFCTHPKSESLSVGEGKALINCIWYLTEL